MKYVRVLLYLTFSSMFMFSAEAWSAGGGGGGGGGGGDGGSPNSGPTAAEQQAAHEDAIADTLNEFGIEVDGYPYSIDEEGNFRDGITGESVDSPFSEGKLSVGQKATAILRDILTKFGGLIGSGNDVNVDVPKGSLGIRG